MCCRLLQIEINESTCEEAFKPDHLLNKSPKFKTNILALKSCLEVPGADNIAVVLLIRGLEPECGVWE